MSPTAKNFILLKINRETKLAYILVLEVAGWEVKEVRFEPHFTLTEKTELDF